MEKKKKRLRTVHDRKHLKIRGVFEDKFISRKDLNIKFHSSDGLESSHKKNMEPKVKYIKWNHTSCQKRDILLIL